MSNTFLSPPPFERTFLTLIAFLVEESSYDTVTLNIPSLYCPSIYSKLYYLAQPK